LLFTGKSHNIVTMLSKIRDKHMRRILWGLVIIIVPAFVLWGGISSFRNRNRDVVAVFNSKKITAEEFQKYLATAQLYILLNIAEPGNISLDDVKMLAVDFMILLDRAAKDNIKVDDRDVIGYVKAHPVTGQFFFNDQFDNQSYQGFLRRISRFNGLPLNPRIFEEHVRNFLLIEKLIDKNVKVKVSDQEAMALYARDHQKAKIAYLFIPYENFKVEIGISQNQINEFYQSNKDVFTRPEKVKLQYVLIDKDDVNRQDIADFAAESVKLSQVSEKFSLELRETDFFALKDPITDIGWEPQINAIAFSLEEGAISEPLSTQKNIILFQKVAARPRHTPPLAEIRDEVKNALINDKAKQDAMSFAKELITKAAASQAASFASLAEEDFLKYKETDFFGYSDYIEGLGLEEAVNSKIFALKESEVYPEPIDMAKGAYVIKLLEKTPIEKSDFESKQKEYTARVRAGKEIAAKERFINHIRSQAELSFLPNFAQ
jgi:hypothetical protein